MTPPPASSAGDPVVVTDYAVKELRRALQAVGIALPSLGIDLPSYGCFSGSPLVELGRCNVDTARRLAAALRRAAEASPSPEGA